MLNKEIEEQIAKEEFGEKLKQIRKAEGFTRTSFAVAIRIPSDTVKGIEQGKHWPSYKVIKAIAAHPTFRKYTLWLLCEFWDDEDDRPSFPMDLEQTNPDEVQFRQLEKKLKRS